MPRRFVGLLSAIAVIVGFGALQSSPAAGHLAGRATAPIQQGNGDCGANDSANPVIGKVRFIRSRDGLTLTVEVTLTGADANASYDVRLFSNTPTFCAQLADLGTVTTDSKGNGRGTFTASVTSDENGFFADPSPGFGDNDTPAVNVG